MTSGPPWAAGTDGRPETDFGLPLIPVIFPRRTPVRNNPSSRYSPLGKCSFIAARFHCVVLRTVLTTSSTPTSPAMTSDHPSGYSRRHRWLNRSGCPGLRGHRRHETLRTRPYGAAQIKTSRARPGVRKRRGYPADRLGCAAIWPWPRSWERKLAGHRLCG
jgi:hypothetical protein